MYEIGIEFKSFQTNLYYMLEKWVVRQDDSFNRFRDDFNEIKATLRYIHQNYEELRTQTAHIDTRVASLEDGSINLQHSQKVAEDTIRFVHKSLEDLKRHTININSRVAALEKGTSGNSDGHNLQKIANLEAKIELMEQQLWECNVEISYLPESRREDLVGIVQLMAYLLQYTLDRHDIVSVHRDPLGKMRGKWPRDVIVKFSNQLIRDNFLKAARHHGGFTLQELNMTGRIHKVYVNEQISPKTKNLLREAHEAARLNDWLYVWVKYGTILVRKGQNTVIFPIYNAGDLAKMN